MRRLSLLLSFMMTVVLAVPAGSATLYGLVDTGELYTSANAGVSWTIKSTLPVRDAVAIGAGDNSDELFLATKSGSIYRSIDAGMNWTATGALTANDVAAMVIKSNGDLILLTETGSVYGSVNDGASFISLSTLTASNHISLEGDEGGGNLYALTKTGEVAKSPDGGATWTVVGTIAVPDAVEVRTSGLTVFVLTSTGDIHRSDDGGVNFTAVGTISQVNMTAMTTDDGALVAASKEGLIATSGDATSWSFTGSINQLNVVAIGNDTPQATGIGPAQPPTLSAARFVSIFPNPRAIAQPLTLTFELFASDQVVFDIYNVAGKKVAARSSQAFFGAGVFDVVWNAPLLPSGIYFVRLSTASGEQSSRKFAVLR